MCGVYVHISITINHGSVPLHHWRLWVWATSYILTTLILLPTPQSSIGNEALLPVLECRHELCFFLWWHICTTQYSLLSHIMHKPVHSDGGVITCQTRTPNHPAHTQDKMLSLAARGRNARRAVGTT